MNRTSFPTLPKWPGLLVEGAPVSQEQAAEILVRTNSHYLSGNDREWTIIVRQVLGFPPERHGHMASAEWRDHYAKEDAARKALGMLSLEYLSNAQIYSSWVGGPHGWMDWKGNVRTANYNVGKWPGCWDILDEWRLIAKTFPFLELTAQLLSGETCEPNIKPLIEFRIAKGKANAYKPGKMLGFGPVGLKEGDFVMLRHHGERGCTVEQLSWAADLVREKMKGVVA